MPKRKTNKEFKEEIFKLTSGEYENLSEYKSGHQKILMKHNICGNEYMVEPTKFLRGNRCPLCVRKNLRKSHNVYEKEFYKAVGNEYTLLSKYTTRRQKVKVRHNCDKCFNYEYEVLPYNIIKGDRCPRCAGLAPKTTIEFKHDVFNLTKDEYNVLGEYKTNKEKILMKHNICEKTFNMSPHDFLDTGNRCPFCKISKGENYISKILDELGLYYVREYKFKDCKYKRLLPFDFAIFDKSMNEIFLIEYDGEFHFKPFNESLNSIKKFEEQKLRDNIKNEYCISNEIKLLKIKYTTDKNQIKKLIIDFLNPYKNKLKMNSK